MNRVSPRAVARGLEGRAALRGRRVAPHTRPGPSLTLGVTVALIFLATAALAETSATPPQLPGRVAIEQHLGAQLPLDTMFRDETGRVVRLRDYANGARPILMVFNYYRCPMLCSMVLEGVASTLTAITFDAGKEYDVVTISIDPRDTPRDAAAKKEKYVKRYGRVADANGWHFLTGPESAIRRVANAAGFVYAYDPQSDQFAHGAALFVLTPDGRVSRVLSGFEYAPRDVRLALVEASSNKIGSAADAVLLLCYHYDPITGKYSRSAMAFVRAGGVATMAGLAGFIFVMVRRERAAR